MLVIHHYIQGTFQIATQVFSFVFSDIKEMQVFIHLKKKTQAK